MPVVSKLSEKILDIISDCGRGTLTTAVTVLGQMIKKKYLGGLLWLSRNSGEPATPSAGHSIPSN